MQLPCLAYEQYAELIQYTASLIPPGITVIVLGDRGFRDVRLMALLRQPKWHFRLRLTENEYVWPRPQQRSSLDSWMLVPYQPCFLQEVFLTDQLYGPVSIAMIWGGDPDMILGGLPATRWQLHKYSASMLFGWE
jgi:hypothetical protein